MERRQAGFSMVELMVALTITLIISGAVYQLMSSGQSAFRREPALADRQQNIRAAMDIISQDVYKAGNALPLDVQVFTQGLNAAGPAMSPVAASGATDQLEMIVTTDCDVMPVCPNQGGASITTYNPLSSCFQFPAVVLLACTRGTPDCPDMKKCKDPDPAKCPTWGVYWAEKPGTGQNNSCKGSGQDDGGVNGHAVLPPGKGEPPVENPPGGPPFQPQWMTVANMVRYRINYTGTVPNLERSPSGGLDENGNPNWQIVARGIEDLQVQYLVGDGATPDPVDPVPASWVNDVNVPPTWLLWQDEPRQVTGLRSVVRKVRISLSGRAVDATNAFGQTTSAVGNAVRGRLVSEITPRATQLQVAMRMAEQ